MTSPDQPSPIPWAALDPARQTELRIAFGHYQDSLPPTCSLETKIARFRAWLGERGIDYPEPGRDATTTAGPVTAR